MQGGVGSHAGDVIAGADGHSTTPGLQAPVVLRQTPKIKLSRRDETIQVSNGWAMATDTTGHCRRLTTDRRQRTHTHTQVATRRVTVVALDSWRRKASLGSLSQLMLHEPMHVCAEGGGTRGGVTRGHATRPCHEAMPLLETTLACNRFM